MFLGGCILFSESRKKKSDELVFYNNDYENSKINFSF